MSKSTQYLALEKELFSHRDNTRAEHSARYFKTGKGEYGEGDVFLGLTVPQIRIIVKHYRDKVTLSDIATLLKGRYHEFRLAALLLMVAKYEKSDERVLHHAIFSLYVRQSKHINNWDLVDTSAPQIIGAYISNHMSNEERREFIDSYIRSRNLWKNRIIVLATLYQIKRGNEKMAFSVARLLLHHPHDLIHKAIGWMLREVGKRDRVVLSKFLDEHAREMPRTMLRYALEHYPNTLRKRYMRKSQYVI